MIASLYRKYFAKYFNQDKAIDNRNYVIVEGMTCNHCVATVTDSLNKVNGIDNVEVDLSSGKAFYSGNIDKSTIQEAVESCGYNVKE